jgi:CheY-like chemotaxis protein
VDGEEAVARYLENQDSIQLLLFDLIMPKKNGKEAYDQIREINPNIRVIFSSGYTADIISQKGLGSDSINLVSKPINPAALAAKVREVLDAD